MIAKLKAIDENDRPDFESSSPHSTKRSLSTKKRFMNGTRTQTRTHFSKPQIKESKGTMWVEYSYRVPDSLRDLYARGWHRFKVYEEINRVGTMEYANELRSKVEQALKQGFNPFKPEEKSLEPETEPKFYTLQQAVLLFKQAWKQKGLEKVSVDKYNTAAERLLTWAAGKGLIMSPAMDLTNELMEEYLYFEKRRNHWANRSFNNQLTFTSTIFNFLVKKKIITVNPCHGIGKLKTISRKHKFYDDKLLTRVKDYLGENDPLLLFACQVIYYLCVRSEKELKNLKVGDIFPERRQVLVRGENAKTDSDRYIPCCAEMMNIFKERKIFDYPKDYYVFTAIHRNKFIADGHPGPVKFGQGFFSDRFTKVRKALKIDNSYTPYGFKHTRVIHLKTDGAKDADIMALTGHKDFASYSAYLRDLGLNHDIEALEEKTRKL